MIARPRPLRLFACVLAVGLLAGCETAPPQQTLPELSFAHRQPFRLDVGRLELVSEYSAPMRAPNVDHVMPVAPERAMQRWAQERLQPLGRTGTARLIVRDAKVVEVPLKVDTGFKGLFKKEQAERYDAILDVVLQVLDERGFPAAEITANASRSRTVPEGISLNDRDRVWFELVESLMKDMDARLEELIRQYMARWIM